MNERKRIRLVFVGVLLITLGVVFNPSISAQTPSLGKGAGNNKANHANIRIRIGIARRSGTVSDEQVYAINAKLMEMLAGTASDEYDAVLLEQKLEMHVLSEATEKKCNYVLYIEDIDSTIGKPKSSGIWGALNPVSIARSVSGVVGGNIPGSSSKISQVGQQAASVEEVFKSISSGTKKKDKIKIAYSLISIETRSRIIPTSPKEKAAAKDGDDVLQGILVSIGDEVLNKIPITNQPILPGGPNTQTYGSSNSNYGSPNSAPKSAILLNSFENQSGATPNSNSKISAFDANITSVGVQDFRLGMTFDEVKTTGKLQPSAKNESDKFGYFDCMYKCSPYNMKFLDGILVEFTISYSGVKWKDNNEFNSAISQNLGLPDKWTKDGTNYYQKFSDYVIVARTNGGSSWISLVNPSYGPELKARRERNESNKKSSAETANEQKKGAWKP